MDTQNRDIKITPIQLFRCFLLIIWFGVLIILLHVHTNGSLTKIPIVGLFLAIPLVFALSIKEIMFVSACASIGLMVFNKKFDYFLFALMLVSFMDAYFQRVLWL